MGCGERLRGKGGGKVRWEDGGGEVRVNGCGIVHGEWVGYSVSGMGCG